VTACRQLQCPLVQISTDYVFAGNRPPGRPWRESDEPHPQGIYALSKLHGEQQAAQWEKHFVVRTCGLYGRSPHNNNFVETMLRLGRERNHLRVVDDQHCTPTYVAHLAAAVLFLLQTENYGIYHIVNSGATTWHEFAGEIFRQARMAVELQPITTAEYGAAAPRPAYSVLDTGKYRGLGGPEMPPWREALAEYLAARMD
jgi:dTDP-4-dehydrorhamnose reductase